MKEIKLSKGFVALVSDEDYERINRHKWCVSRESRDTKWYAIRWITISPKKRIKVRMSYAVFGIPPLEPLLPGFILDHLNDDGLDNQRCNLRLRTQVHNMHRCPGWKRKQNPLEISL